MIFKNKGNIFECHFVGFGKTVKYEVANKIFNIIDDELAETTLSFELKDGYKSFKKFKQECNNVLLDLMEENHQFN